MPDLQKVEEFTYFGEPGFKLSYEYTGLSGQAVKGRAVGRLASKYPLKANKIKVLKNQPVDTDGVTKVFDVEMFVPLDGIEDNRGVEAIRSLIQQL